MANLMEKIFGPLSAGSLRLASTDVKVNHIVSLCLKYEIFVTTEKLQRPKPSESIMIVVGLLYSSINLVYEYYDGQALPELFRRQLSRHDQLEHAPSKNTGVESTLKYHSDIKKSEFKFQDQDSTSTLSTGQSNHMEAAMGKSKTVLQNFTAHPGWGGILDVQAESGIKSSLLGKSATNTLPQL
ncbi:putative UDP-glycosyltransferase 74F2-like [Capsicum annuum]|nr:putative UDP-glycosyltransferase 74F2-like [Capsicum annuum]